MNNKHLFFLFFIGIQSIVCTQTLDSIQKLNEVIIKADRLLYNFSSTQNVQILKDSVFVRSKSSLTNLLDFNSAIYFKENGLGMVSSPSFRGTTAQQTAVIWNGININSQLNGQTDFNVINTRDFDVVAIRSGGGSVIYGSGAIGGSIHLNNSLFFGKGFTNDAFVGYGSFNTQDVSLHTNFSDEKISIGFSVAYASSDNDFKIRSRDRNNENGQFYNVSTSTQLGYKINPKNTIRFYNQTFYSDRHFSLVLPSDSKTKYLDLNTRNLLEWENKQDKFLSVLRTAYLTEKYQFFENIERDDFSFGAAKSFIGNYQLNYNLSNKTLITGIAELNSTTGTGTNATENRRDIVAFSGLLKRNSLKWNYEVSVRKEATSNYESPLLFALGTKYQLLRNYAFSFNASKNFRIPTFNDLYWIGSGNENLNPELSHQVEFGNYFQFKNFSVSATGFYYNIEDMIRWLPNSNGLWQPINTDHVISYGLESQLKFYKEWQNHQLTLNANYAYVVSENEATNKQLIYVPFHKVSGSVNYQYKKIKTYLQHNFVGDVFIQSDNNPNEIVPAYFIQNLGFDYTFKSNQTIGFTVRNLFNVDYQSVADRFMPGRNYNIYINFNF
jgi:iron complex outermembrane receptor protein